MHHLLVSLTTMESHGYLPQTYSSINRGGGFQKKDFHHVSAILLEENKKVNSAEWQQHYICFYFGHVSLCLS